MKIKDSAAFVTGANRGLGLAPVYASLARGASKVYAGVRDPAAIDTVRGPGPIRMSQAYTPLLAANGGGAMVNVPPVELAGTVALSSCLPGKEIKKRSNTMLKLKQKFILLLSLSFSLGILASSAYAFGATGTKADYGAAVSTDFAGRQISVTPTTKGVYVTNGETVRFTANGQNFTWHFDTFGQTSLDLSVIAPNDAHVKGVRVYVASNPLYLGGL
jgi:hypothetical protein